MNSKQLKLAFFLPNLNGAGAERVLLNLAHGIALRDYDVDIVASSAQGKFLSRISPHINIVDLGVQRVRASILPLSSYLRKNQPDVMMAALHANFAAILAKRLAAGKTKIVVTQHAHISTFSGNARNWRERVEPQFARYLFPQADHIIAVSQGVADDLSYSSKIERNQIDVIYNPVIMPSMEKMKHANIQHPWFDEGQPPVILGIGRLMPQKNFVDLIEAFAAVRKKRPVRLMILGEGAERPMLEQHIQELGVEADVSLPGFVDNPYAYMTHADLFVLSSIFEGLPTVLVEALYCGLPIVATDCPSGPDEILDGGRYGHLTPTKDPQALADNIERALSGDIPSPTIESWQPYEMNRVVDQYLSVLTN